MKRLLVLAFGIAVVAALATSAFAVPLLQLYLEGGTYDAASESWVLQTEDPIRLWVIGNVAATPANAGILDVKLAIAYDSGLAPIFGLTPTTTGNYGGFTDPSVPVNPSYIKTVTNGSSPIMGDGSSLGAHGIYGTGTYWQEFLLGDFILTDSPVDDFITSFPTLPFPSTGQINVYQISITGVPVGASFHFDAYDHYVKSNDKLQYIFAPFSHDADGSTIPEPSSLLLLATGILGTFGYSVLQKRNGK